MAIKGINNPTIADVAARLEDKKIAAIIELMASVNEVLEDMTWIQCNDGTNHKTTVRSGMPSVTWRKLYQGVQPSKSRTVQVKDACGMLEGYSEIDKSLADINGNSSSFRLSEDVAFLESFNQEIASTIFYGNTDTDPEKFMGLSPRYDSLSAENATNIIDGGGVGSDNTSVWFVVWSPSIAHGLYPNGSSAGFYHNDLGEQTVADPDGGQFQAYRAHYKWDAGMTVRDWRGISRICNIDVSELADAGETGFDGANLPNMFIKAYNKIKKKLKMGRAVIYCNETVMTAVDLIASNKSNTWFTTGDGIDGMPIVKFRGLPIKQCDALLETEARVV